MPMIPMRASPCPHAGQVESALGTAGEVCIRLGDEVPQPSTQPGSACPIGATPMAGGVNFSVYADKAEAVELLLFDGVDDPQPAQVFRARSGAAPHLPLLARVHPWRSRPARSTPTARIGPNAPPLGLRFDATRYSSILMASAVAIPSLLRPGSRQPARRRHGGGYEERGGGSGGYDWEGDRPLRRPYAADRDLRNAPGRLHTSAKFRRRAGRPAPTPG